MISLELRGAIAAVTAGLAAVGGSFALSDVVRHFQASPAAVTAAAPVTASDATASPTSVPSQPTLAVPPTAPAAAPSQAGAASPGLPAASSAPLQPAPAVTTQTAAPVLVSPPGNPRLVRRTEALPVGVVPTPNMQPRVNTVPPTQPMQQAPPAGRPAAAPATPSAPSPAMLAAAGRALYGPACANCHGGNGQGVIGPSLHQLRDSDAQIIAIIKNGKGAMPAYAGKYTDAQMQMLLFYIRSLR